MSETGALELALGRRRSATDGAGCRCALWRRSGSLLVVVVFGIFPVAITDPTATSIAVFTLIFMVATAAWNVFSGYSGYLALGHAVFFGSGGYAVALAARDWHFKGGWDVFALLPFAGLVAAADRDPGGSDRAAHPPPHVRGGHDRDLLHLPAGRLQPRVHRRHLGHPAALSRRSRAANYNQPFYYVALVILVLTVAMSWAVRRSRFGLQLLAIRDDEDRARGLGVKTRRVKLIAFVLSRVPGRDGRRAVLLLPRSDLSRSSHSTRCSTSRSP